MKDHISKPENDHNPHGDNNCHANVTQASIKAVRCCDCSSFCQHLGWNQSNGEPESAGCDDEIIKITKYRNKIGNEVNRAEGMCHHKKDQSLCIPRGTRVLG